jgi:hypothetical protein
MLEDDQAIAANSGTGDDNGFGRQRPVRDILLTLAAGKFVARFAGAGWAGRPFLLPASRFTESAGTRYSLRSDDCSRRCGTTGIERRRGLYCCASCGNRTGLPGVPADTALAPLC